jgi:hypothetical protein
MLCGGKKEASHSGKRIDDEKLKERMMADNFVIFKFHRPQNFAGRKIN